MFDAYDLDFVMGMQDRLVLPETVGLDLLAEPVPESDRVYIDAMHLPVQGCDGYPNIYSRFNLPFYAAGSRAIFGNFSTGVMASATMAEADAAEFIRFVHEDWKKNGSIAVFEFGIGTGKYAADFVKAVLEKDEAVGSRLEYWLVDGSEQMLADFEKNVRWPTGMWKFAHADVAVKPIPDEIVGIDNVALIRHNELYDDLPAQELIVHDGKLYETWLRLYFAEKRHPVAEMSFLESVMRKDFSRFELEGIAADFDARLVSGTVPLHHLYGDVRYAEVDPDKYPLPTLLPLMRGSRSMFNYAAYQHLAASIEVLKKTGGYMRFNDYFMDGREPDLRHVLSRFAWKQVSGGTNLMHLLQIADVSGCSFDITHQTDHISTELGEQYIEPSALYDRGFVDFVIEKIEEVGGEVRRAVLEKQLKDYGDKYFGKSWIPLADAMPVPPDGILENYFNATSTFGPHHIILGWKMQDEPKPVLVSGTHASALFASTKPWTPPTGNAKYLRFSTSGLHSDRAIASMVLAEGRNARYELFRTFAQLGRGYKGILESYFSEGPGKDLPCSYTTVRVSQRI